VLRPFVKSLVPRFDIPEYMHSKPTNSISYREYVAESMKNKFSDEAILHVLSNITKDDELDFIDYRKDFIENQQDK